MQNSQNETDAALDLLLAETKKFIAGDRSAADHIVDMPVHQEIPPKIREFAEWIGRLIVNIESREYKIEIMVEDLLKKQLALENARLDALTNLPNRSVFHERLEAALKSANKNHTCLTVIFIDLDKFKPVNDTLGHEAGDQLLIMVAQRLTRMIRADDVTARLGGDEFAMVLTTPQTKTEVFQISARILNTLATPFALSNGKVNIGGSIGLAFYPTDGETSTALLKSADMAMYRAKSQGRNTVCCYNSADQAALQSVLDRAVQDVDRPQD